MLNRKVLEAMGLLILVSVILLIPGPGRAQMEQATVAIPAPSLTFTPNYIADAMGFWEKEGLKVTLKSVRGIGAANAVLAGSIEFSNSSGPTVIRANARGQKLFAIASTLDRPTVEIVMSKAAAQKAGIDSNSSLEKKAQALRGRTIAVDSINSVVHGYLKYFARKGGVDPEKDISVAPMSPPNMIAAFKKKAIDGYTMSLPWPLIAVHSGEAIRLVSSPLGDLKELNPFAYNVVLTRADFVDKKPQVCAKFVAGIQQALKYMQEKPKECLEILRKPFGRMNPSVLEKAFELIRQSSSKTGKIGESSLTQAQEFMLATGILKPSEKLTSFSSIYTNRFVK